MFLVCCSSRIAFANTMYMSCKRTNEELLCALDASMEKERDQAHANWTTKYLRDTTPSRGVRIPKLRKVVADWYNENSVSSFSGERQREMAYELVRKKYFEDKLAGTVLLQDHVMPRGELRLEHLHEVECLYTDGSINDWSTCDWFCVRVLGKLAKEEGGVAKLLEWADAENLWQARSSLVSVLSVSELKRHHEEMMRTARVVIARDERFAKTAVGWLLREIANVDKRVVRNFLDDELQNFSKEALGKVTKAFGEKERKTWSAKLKEVGNKE